MNKHSKFWPALLLGMAMLLSVSFLFGQSPAKTEGSSESVLSPTRSEGLTGLTITADLEYGSAIETNPGTYDSNGSPKSEPQLVILEIKGNTGGPISLSPAFSSTTYNYSCAIMDYDPTVKLILNAPSDCQVYINDGRVSSNGESILRIEPTHPTSGPIVITYTIKVENSAGSKEYVINFTREVNERLDFGRTTGSNPRPRLASATGNVFGVNTSTDKLTVQAWVRWTETPGSSASANIASQTTSSDGSSGLFWLQHSGDCKSFEFAVRTDSGTNPRRFAQSDPTKVTIQQGVWYLVTGVYDGSLTNNNVKIYVNNSDVSISTPQLTGNLFSALDAAKFNVGVMFDTYRSFPGNVRALRIWVGTARSAQEIASDYTGTSSDDSSFSWPLNETAVGSVAQGKGSLSLSMVNVTDADFASCCVYNSKAGQTLLHRPERMDLSAEASESVILVQASGYSDSDYRFRILGQQGSSTGMQAWDHNANNGAGGWVGSGTISTGVMMDSELGNPVDGTRFWVPVRRNNSTAGAGRYVDDDSSYDGSDTDGSKYNTIMPLTPVIKMGSTMFALSGELLGGGDYPLSKKYVILGYDAVEKGKLITGTSSAIGSGKYDLISDVPLYRIEVRTQRDVLISELTNASGWNATTGLDDITLPVELSSFTVTPTQNGAKLQWVSQSESNLIGYHVYRAELNDFSQALQVSALIEATNASHTQVYVFTDSGLQPLVTYYYWLMASEYSGVSQIFGPIHITLAGEEQSPELPVKTGLDKLYPNPFNPEISIRYGLTEAADLKLSIYNLKGQKVHSLEIQNQNKGFHKYLWDASQEASGIYFIVFEAAETREMRKITLSK